MPPLPTGTPLAVRTTGLERSAEPLEATKASTTASTGNAGQTSRWAGRVIELATAPTPTPGRARGTGSIAPPAMRAVGQRVVAAVAQARIEPERGTPRHAVGGRSSTMHTIHICICIVNNILFCL